MDAAPDVWHTQVEPEEGVDNRPECSICFTSYDNIFKTPKVLHCSHTFCLECVARLVASLPPESKHDKVLCPLCRQPTAIPENGVPELQTSQELLSNLPSHLQHEETVWIEGNKLCYKQDSQSNSSNQSVCICVDIGMSKKDTSPEPVPRSRFQRFCCGCSDWKRLLLIAFMVVILFCILLWPVQCILKTGNLRCTTETSPTKVPLSSLMVTLST
ncbi:RING finger protein 223 [Pseudophryne corroboree]|uniref:RING finger protein 223 n=1 Tax=Pseudophryne corroboree TaxID=495146 RepID=UPI003081BA8B